MTSPHPLVSTHTPLAAAVRGFVFTALVAALAACGNSGDLGGGGTSSASLSVGVDGSVSGGGSGSGSGGGSGGGTGGAAKPLIETTSADTLPTGCSPKQVVTDGGWASCNMEWLGRIPVPGVTIGGRKIGDIFYLSNWTNGFHAFDVKDPANPKLLNKLFVDGATGSVLAAAVENEDPAVTNKIAVLSRTLNKDAIVIDTSNPLAMKVLGTVPGGDAHTHTCLNDCTYSYGSTTGVIIDLRDPKRPALLPKKWSDIVGLPKGAHDVTEIRPGLVITASDPALVLDTTDPANPKKLFALPQTDPENPGGQPGPAQSGRIGHNNWWPRQGADKFFMGLSEGAYDGICDTFPKDGRSIYLFDTTGWQQKQTFTPVSRYTLVRGNADTGAAGGTSLVDSNGNPSGVETSVQGCSVHWFDPHPSFKDGGLVAMASFSHGMRLLKAQPDGRMDQVGYFVSKATLGQAATVDVRWISDRIMYVMDVTNGTMDVVRYNGPLPAAN